MLLKKQKKLKKRLNKIIFSLTNHARHFPCKSIAGAAPSEFTETLRKRAEECGGCLIELDTVKLKMSQFDHTTEDYVKKSLKTRVHVLRSDNSVVLHRDKYSAFLARNVKLTNLRKERKKHTKVERYTFDSCEHNVRLLKEEFSRQIDLLRV